MDSALSDLINTINWAVANSEAVDLTDIPILSLAGGCAGNTQLPPPGEYWLNQRVKLTVVDDAAATIYDTATGMDYYFAMTIDGDLRLEDGVCKNGKYDAVKLIYDCKVPMFAFSKSNFEIVIEFPESDVGLCSFPIMRDIGKMHDIIDLWTTIYGPLPFVAPMELYVKVNANYKSASVNINYSRVCNINTQGGKMSFGEWDAAQDQRIIAIKALLYELMFDIFV